MLNIFTLKAHASGGSGAKRANTVKSNMKKAGVKSQSRIDRAVRRANQLNATVQRIG